MSVTRLNPDKTGNIADIVVGKFTLTITSSAGNIDVTFPRALPSGKSYFAVVTPNTWISVHNAKPVYSIRSISNTGMNVHWSLPTTYSDSFEITTGYIAVAY